MCNKDAKLIFRNKNRLVTSKKNHRPKRKLRHEPIVCIVDVYVNEISANTKQHIFETESQKHKQTSRAYPVAYVFVNAA